MEKNSVHIVDIVSYSSEGDGIGRIDGMAVFVKGALVGEQVEIKIIKVAKNLAYGRLLKVHKASANRIKPDCKFAMQCGGCSLRHMTYDEELKFKLQRVNDALQRIGKLDFRIEKIHGAKDILRYRNKAAFPIGCNKNGEVQIGLFQARSHNIIDIDKCLIQTEQAEEVISIVKNWMTVNKIKAYNEENQSGLIRHVLIRTNANDELLICLVATKDKIPQIDSLISALENSKLKIHSLVCNINDKNTNVILGSKFNTLWKDDFFTDEICNLKFRLSAPSFFQVNRTQAEVLYKTALGFADIQKSDTALDLYCGTGTITLLLAQKCKKAIGVEIVTQAIADAKQNAKLNNISNAEFICASSSEIANKFANENFTPDIICVDPPRKGLDTETINSIIKILPKNLIYISCDPGTLSRDLKILTDNDYTIKNAEAIDMFPRTPHIETAVFLRR